MALTRYQAKTFIDAFLSLRNNASDALASLAIAAYPELDNDGELIKAGTRINWNGNIKRAATDLWDTAENTPDNAPSLWEDINYVNGYRLIPENITVGLAFAKGECGWWKDELYKSLIDTNVYTPDQYSIGWEKI